MSASDEKKPEDTKYEDAEEVGLEGLVPGGTDQENDDDAPPPEETRTPFDEA